MAGCKVRVGRVKMGLYVLLNGRSSINIILEGLWKKLRLKKLQPTPFIVQMVD
jgi:hypothetical protein